MATLRSSYGLVSMALTFDPLTDYDTRYYLLLLDYIVVIKASSLCFIFEFQLITYALQLENS